MYGAGVESACMIRANAVVRHKARNGMKKLGIIGGLGPESTVDYYRSFIAAYRSRINDGSYPNFVVNSINLTRVMGHVAAAQQGELVDFLADELEVLAKAGADLALISANTPHIAFDEIQRRSPIPIISIVGGAIPAMLALRKFPRTILFATSVTRFDSRASARYALTIPWFANASCAVSVSSLLPSKLSRARFLRAFPNLAVRTAMIGASTREPSVSRQLK